MATPIRISVALVTRNRPESLRRCLASWARQTVRPAEIVVSDDSDTTFAAAVAEVAAGAGVRLVGGPRRGLYANRNHAAVHCGGSHILSADDDHEHPVDYLEKIMTAVTADPAAVWCMGEVYSRAALERAEWQGPGQMSAKGALVEASDDPADCWAIADGATVYPRAIFDSGVRFFARAKFGDCYKEFGCVLHWLGYRIRPLRTTGVVHHLHEIGRSFAPSPDEKAAAFFSMLMFSFHYHRSARNRGATVAQIARSCLSGGLRDVRSLPRAIRWFRERRQQVAQWPRAETTGGAWSSGETERHVVSH